MKIAFSWLKEFVDINITPQELEEKLFSCGFEVEEIKYLAQDIDRVVAGKITSIKKQEGTSHLNLCVLDCGQYGKDIQITTGAQNVYEGAMVCTALDGATLPGGIKIKAKELQGIKSNGMLCSGAELGINDDWYDGADVDGILILDDSTKPGDNICDIVGLNDYIFDISITANRPDCQSVLGMAREVSALLNTPLKMPDTSYTCTSDEDNSISVVVEDETLCPRYMAHYVKNIRPSKSPLWLRRHLALAGLRSINNVVDITNHSLIEIGQPMHAFDLSKIADRKIIVRRANNGESITTLDEKEFNLTNDNLVICDAKGPVAIAGVMGGLHSGIADDSKELLFECATFARDSVRKTSRALGQSSDSSLRYEKGVDAYSTGLAIKRALHLIQKLDCGDVTKTSFDCAVSNINSTKTLNITPQQIYAVLGITVPKQCMIDILSRLNFEVKTDGDNWTVQVPRYREDIHDFPDIAEEIIREYGYEHIVPTFLQSAAVTSGGLNSAQKMQVKVKQFLAGQGFYEINTLAFYSKAELDMMNIAENDERRKAIRLLNPITEHLSIMRTTLAPSMLNIIVDNIKKDNTQGRLFEISNVYLPKELPLTQQPKESLQICMGVFGKEEDFYTLKGAVQELFVNFGVNFEYEKGGDDYLHPGISAQIMHDGKVIGVFGKLANEVSAKLDLPKDRKFASNIYIAHINYEQFVKAVPSGKKYVPISNFAPIKRDLALVCDEAVTCKEIQDVIYAANKMVKDAALFDVYRSEEMGTDKKSMAFAITLSDNGEIDQDTSERIFNKIINDLKYKLNINIR